MTLNLNSSLAGLGILTGSNTFGNWGGNALTVESLAVRRAKAAFTTPQTTPPWKLADADAGFSTQISAIRRLATIIDTKPPIGQKLTNDVATAFTTYKALDRLRVLAEAAVAGGSDAVRKPLQTVFAKGLKDLEAFTGTAPGDLLAISFNKSSSIAKSVAIPAAGPVGKIIGKGVAEARSTPLTALSGTERFVITIARGSASDSITVDLAGGPQPPTLDSISATINQAIADIPMRKPDGTPNLDENGNPTPRWLVRFVPDKSTGSWGFKIENPGLESVSIDQIGANDALMVATGMNDPAGPSSVQMMRFNDAAGDPARQTLSLISGIDRLASERAALNAPKTKPVEGVEPPSTERAAATSAQAIVTAADGASYVVGTTAGDLDANRVAGAQDLFLTKLDSEGRVLWQRQLGATGSASGAAVQIGPSGEIVVAGTVSGSFDGVQSDGDMVVVRFDAEGAELSSTLIRAQGSDSATALAVGADGSIYVGGRAAGGGGNAFVARLDANGVLRERRSIDSGGSDTVTALAIDQDGALLALTNEGGIATLRRMASDSLTTELGSLALGRADARVLAVGADGTIAVGGAASSALSGSQVNAISGARDGFVAQIGADLSGAQVSYIGTGGDDQIDSLAFLNGTLYAGGRTNGDLAGTRRGTVDGFLARLDAATGTVAHIQQFGLATRRADPVRIAAATGGSTVLGALGLRRGALGDQPVVDLTAQTSLRAGDQFAIRVGDGAARRITIDPGETMTTLADKVSKITGTSALVTTPAVAGLRTLNIVAKAGSRIELVAGGAGRDALAKLGLPAAKLIAPPAASARTPKVSPGGSYGLGLTHALDLSTKESAAIALGKIKSAISMTQTAYRSLYWDDGKARLVDGTPIKAGVGSASPYQQAQIARYQDALTRISGLTSSFGYTNY